MPACDLMPVLRNSIVGYFSASKKSPVRRWLSRSTWPVCTLAVWIVAVTDDCSGSSAMVMVASASEKLPRTLLTMRCRTTKPTRLCAASSR